MKHQVSIACHVGLHIGLFPSFKLFWSFRPSTSSVKWSGQSQHFPSMTIFGSQRSVALKLYDKVSPTSSGKRTYLGFKCLGEQDVGCLHISMNNRSGTPIMEVVQGPCSPHSNFVPHLPLNYSSLFPTYNIFRTNLRLERKKIELTPILPPVWFMELLHLIVYLVLYNVIPKWTSWELRGM